MDSKFLQFQILNGSITRRVFFRSIMLASAISVVSMLRVFSTFDLLWFPLPPVTYIECASSATAPSHGARHFLTPFLGSFGNGKRDANLTVNVVTELMAKQLLHPGAKSLCVGEGSLTAVMAMKCMGFPSVTGVHWYRFFSLMQKKIVYELDYPTSSFDFVLSRDLDKVSVPALLVLEVERVLRPGGLGALLVSSTGPNNPNDLIRSATPVSSLLRSSGVVHIGSVDDLNLVVFKKRSENASAAFYQYPLPADCASITFTKPLIELMEPLVSERPHHPVDLYNEKRIPYLPKFVDVSKRKRLVYVDIGVGELLNANASDWFLPNYPIDQKDFNVYFVHYNTSIMLSYVKRPGVTFVYHPGLAGKPNVKASVGGGGDADGDGDFDPFVGEDEFDFAAWFKETVKYADFVVLKMNSGKVELKFLSDIFENGAICFVDELFLRCPESNSHENCMNIYKGLRSNGVYVHQWWGD